MRLVFLFFLFFGAQLGLGFEIPTGLRANELEKVVKIIGTPTSTKVVGNPYPLGDYEGLELGISFELIRTSELAQLGNKTAAQREFTIPRLTIGKGLYNDVDLFFHFVPYSEESQITEFGGMLRWGIYQGEFLPVSWTLLTHGSSLNAADKFIAKTYGLELMLSLNAEDFSLYFGGGQIESNSQFVKTIIDSSDTQVAFNTSNMAEATVRQMHTFVGIHFQLSPMFIALQIDRYEEPVYSAKFGFRL